MLESSKFASKMIGKGDKDGEGKSLFESSSDISKGTSQETSQKAESISTNPQNSHSNSEVKQESKHDSSFSNKDNTIISQNENELNTGNSKSKDILKNAVKNQISELDKNVNNMSEGDYISKHNELSDIEDRIDKDKSVHTKALNNAGINTKDLGLSLNDKGFVDIASSDAKFEKASKAYESALEKQSTKEASAIETPDASKPQSISLGSQTAQDRWLDEQMKHFDSDTEKGKAAIERLESLKGKDLAGINDFDKRAIGLDSNAMHRIGQIDDGMLKNIDISSPNSISEQGFFEKRFGAIADAMEGPGNWKTKVGLAASAMILGSQSETFANAMNAIDPTQIIMGPELGTGSDILPIRNTQQAFQQEMTNGLPQQLQSQMQSMAVGNSMNLTSNANTMHLDSIGGQVNIGQNSAGMLRVNGMQTQLPYANFQGAMQNDIMRNNFANMVSGIDMNNGNPFEGQSIHSVDGLMDQMQQRFNTQEYYAMGQRKDVNMIGSYAEESFEKMEELMQSNDTFIERIEDLQKTINNY